MTANGISKRHGPWLVLAYSLLGPNTASADDAEAPTATDEREHTIIVGIGGAGELEFAGAGSLHLGANLMMEWEAIPDRLEFEIGVSLLAADGGLEVPIDLLVKKPFRLSLRNELMIGAGPEITPSTTHGTQLGAEAAADFMFWPWPRYGLWAEPSYDITFHDGVSHSLTITAGVIVGW